MQETVQPNGVGCANAKLWQRSRLRPSVIALIVGLCTAGSSQQAVASGKIAGEGWVLLATSQAADAAVFSRSEERRIIERGELIPDTRWQLNSVTPHGVRLSTLAINGASEILAHLEHGELVPEPPDPSEIGLKPIEVPVISGATQIGDAP